MHDHLSSVRACCFHFSNLLNLLISASITYRMQRYDCSRCREGGERCAEFVPVPNQMVCSHIPSVCTTVLRAVDLQGMAPGQRLCLCAHSESTHSINPTLPDMISLPPKGGCSETHCPSFRSTVSELYYFASRIL
jgi:hypothetical protein